MAGWEDNGRSGVALACVTDCVVIIAGVLQGLQLSDEAKLEVCGLQRWADCAPTTARTPHSGTVADTHCSRIGYSAQISS